MNDAQWKLLREEIAGKPAGGLAGFIVDSPWLPKWHGIGIRDYIADRDLWFGANRAAIERFPSLLFLPGFWAEYGMCTEPSAFGARCSFPADEFPQARPAVLRVEDLDSLEEPDPESDGLLPFALERMAWAESRMRGLGHRIRFSVSRGPLNVASFLMGMTEFMIALKTEPERARRLLGIVTSFLSRWHALQRERFPSIEGMLVLDDVVGFVGEEDFVEFGLPRFRELFSPDLPVKFFHNDADCAASAKYYPGIGINLYNPGVHRSIAEIVEWTEGRVAVLGGIPPRDVLAAGTPRDVSSAVREHLASLPAGARVIHSCSGGMPPGVPTENIEAFLAALR